MNFYAFSGLLNGLAATISGVLIFGKNPKSLKHRAYGIYCLAAAIWGFGYWAWHLSTTPEMALLWVRVLMFGAIFLPIAYVLHVLTLVDRVEEFRWVTRVGWGLGVFFALANFTPWFVQGVGAAGSFALWPIPGPVFHLYVLWFCLFTILGTWWLYQGGRSKVDSERYWLWLLMGGSLIAYAGGATTFPLWYGVDIPPVGAILLVVYTGVVALSLLRHHLLDIGTTFERSMTAGVLIALVALPAYPILLIGQTWSLGTINFPYSLVELTVLLILVVGATLMKGDAQAMISQTLFKERHERNTTVVNFSKSLVSILELKDLTKTIIETICPLLHLQWGVVYLRGTQSQIFQAVSSHGKSLDNFMTIDLGKYPTLAEQWGQGTSPYTIKELQRHPSRAHITDLIDQFSLLDARACLPLSNKQRVLGICLFGPPDHQGEYSNQDLELLSTLSHEASIALDNAFLYEEVKHSQALIRRTDRLRSLETMAGGLAHEIRNPLTSIKAFVDLAPERKDDEQFLVRFSRVVKEDVFRIERLTREILDYAKPMEPFLKEEDLNEVVESCLYTLKIRPSHEIVVMETDLAHELPKIFADRQQLKQVLLNLLFNAVESMLPQGGILTVRTRKILMNQENWVQVEVQDTGAGIAPEDVEHIFDPFFTTKHLSQEHEGTGLGLAIAHQIIQEHQGTVDVQSVQGRGTTFFVNLPQYNPETPSTSPPNTENSTLTPGSP